MKLHFRSLAGVSSECIILGRNKSKFYNSRSQVNVWCRIMNNTIIGPCFIKKHLNQNSFFFNLLQTFLLPSLNELNKNKFKGKMAIEKCVVGGSYVEQMCL